jgi:hypothetical protein
MDNTLFKTLLKVSILCDIKKNGCISNFHFLVMAHSFWLLSDLLFFLSKKLSKKGHRRRLHPGGGRFPDLALVLL